MKVYVVIESWVCDSGENGNSVVAFSTFEKAKEYMNKTSEEYKNEEHYDYDTFEENEESFSAYIEGEYCYNHTDLEIYELEIDRWCE